MNRYTPPPCEQSELSCHWHNGALGSTEYADSFAYHIPLRIADTHANPVVNHHQVLTGKRLDIHKDLQSDE